MKNKIKFVYFDMGGVVIQDFSATNKWEQRIAEIKNRFGLFEKEVCVGRNVDDFKQILKNEFGIQRPENSSILNDFVGRFKRNEIIWNIINKCKNSVKIGLLTNAYPGMVLGAKRRNLFPEITWDVIVDSSIEKCKKPEIEIYQISEIRAGVRAEEILFIDNAEKNLVVPKEMGWQIFLYDSADYEKSNRELEKYLNLPPNPSFD